MTKIPLEDTGGAVSPWRVSLLPPKAPGLKEERYAGRAIPERVFAMLPPRAAVFEAPGGAHLLFLPDKKNKLQHTVALLEPDADAPTKLSMGRAYWPFPHAWTPDGARLFVGCMHELWMFDRESGEATSIERTRPGTKLTAVAVAGQLVAVEGPDRFTVHTVADRREVTSERGGEGRVVALCDGRFLLQSSQGVARLYAVRGEECELVASLNEPIMGAWEEGGVLYANLSVDRGTGARELHDLVRTYRIVGIDDLYPAAWKD